MKQRVFKQISLNVQLMVTMMLLVMGVIGLCIFVNNTFLVRYYQYIKKQDMLESFDEINQAATDGVLDCEDFDIPFERICAERNISIFIVDAVNRKIIRSSMNDIKEYQLELYDMLGEPGGGELEIIEETDNFSLVKRNDIRLSSEYLIIFGTLDCGHMIYMRTAMESIRESAALTNVFFTVIGIIMVLISGIVIFFLARTISRPIRELTNVSKRMAQFDFEVKYDERSAATKEITELGYHMNELSSTLEQTISELKVANNELQQDIRKKEEIDVMRKEFLSNVSHELKTPIALISGYAEGLKECVNDDAESREFYCDVIIDESDKMGKMVKQLLSLNQLEFGNDTVEMERFDITEVIRGVCYTQNLLASQDQIDISFEETEPTYVWGDSFKIEEVVTNYLTNAIHYAAGDKKVRIYYTREEEVLRVHVFNTGQPIPEEDLERIWIKFYKVDKARTREYGGSGIGLSIVKAIMDSMHRPCGAINHENGVEFWFELEKA